MQATIQKVKSDDGTLIACWRSGTGPPLVLVHGTSALRPQWPAVIGELEKRFTVYAVDRRGRGESGDNEPYATEREFEDVAAVVEAIGGPVRLLGHSFGAFCSVGAALLSRNVHKLVLYEPPAYMDKGDALVAGVPPDAGLDVDGFLSRLEAAMKVDVEQGLVFFLRTMGGMPPEMIEGLRSQPAWQERLKAAPTILREIRGSWGYRIRLDQLQTIEAPTLSLVGGESPAWRRASADAFSRVLPNARVTVLPEQGHAAMFAAPTLFVDEVLGFLGH